MSSHPDAHFLFIGDGKLRSELVARVRNTGLSSSIHFLGIREDVPSLLASSDLFVLPSLSEGMSNVLLEAMACGLPIVATAVGGNSDLIRDRYNGLLIPPRNPTGLQNALLELLKNDRLAQTLGNAARRTVEEHYSMERIADDYVSLYNRLGTE